MNKDLREIKKGDVFQLVGGVTWLTALTDAQGDRQRGVWNVEVKSDKGEGKVTGLGHTACTTR